MILFALSVCIAAQSSTPAMPPEMRLMRYPSVHGNQVVFTYASDLWVSNLKGGYARRLTSHPGLEQKAYFSPDGKEIAFTGQYDGNTDVYVMPAEGGEPKRLTYETGVNVCEGWTPDGKIIYLSSYASVSYRQQRMWLIDIKGGLPKATPVLEAADVWFSPDGQKVAYNRQGSNRFNWRRYRGGSQGVISIYDLKANTYKELPHGRENSWNPMWVGNSIYYVSDKNLKTINLYRYDLDSGKATELTDYSDADIHWPSTDGKTIVFERDGYLYSYAIATGSVNRLSPMIRSDLLATRPQLRHLAISAFALSPSGARVVAEARGHIFSIPAKHGETRDFTANESGYRARFPDWSPDGKTIAFMSDKSGEYQIYTVPQMGGEPTQVTDNKGPSILSLQWAPDSKRIVYTTADLELNVLDTETKKVTTVFTDPYSAIAGFDFSPDGKWLVFTGNVKNQFGATFLYNFDSGKTTQVTDGFYNDTLVTFDLSGKYLYLVSDRTYNPVNAPFGESLFLGPTSRVYVLTLAKDTKDPLVAEDDEEHGAPPAGARPRRRPSGPPPGEEGPSGPPPTKIDLDGLGNRIVPLPLPARAYSAIIGSTNGVFISSQGDLVRYDLTEKAASPILVGFPGAITFNADRTKLAYLAGTTLGVADIHPGPPITPGTGKVDLTNVEAVIDPRAEWKQIFWEAWRYERDNFYDKNFLGMNWANIGKRYAAYLPYVAHRADLNYVLGLMIGEFGTSHAYVLGGDMGAPLPAIPTGELGADYVADSGKVKLAKVYQGEDFSEDRRGPLSDPGVNVKSGDYLLAIDGQPVDVDHSPASRLVDKAGKEVVLTVNSSPTLEGSHTVAVRPVASETDLRYHQWVADNRKYVSDKSGGRIGYIHVPDTSEPGMSGFLEGYYSQNDKDAVIIDERWNAGGHLPTFFIEWLSRTYFAIGKARYGGEVGTPSQILTGPRAMLINGYSGSGGDLFPWFFRHAKLGPLIGERTWGGLVGISGFAPLLDGGEITSPAFGIFDQTTGKWIAENNGVEPDIEVDARPDLVAKGEDPQLDAAIKYLQDELQKHPAPAIKQPVYPRVVPMPSSPVDKSGGK
ncbi:MAG TPA: PDZ domain-containing protein [Fimbriimonadaceae bacterium]|jgi:tricorn protease